MLFYKLSIFEIHSPAFGHFGGVYCAKLEMSGELLSGRLIASTWRAPGKDSGMKRAKGARVAERLKSVLVADAVGR
jgi:hypothetical protein